MMDQNLKSFIDWMILRDEGGWKLTSNADDPDGGWTYAGVTTKIYEVFQKKRSQDAGFIGHSPRVSRNKIEELLEKFRDRVNEDIYQIYFDEFIKPIAIDKLPQPLQPAALSCAVNIGPANAVKCLQRAVNVLRGGEDLKVDGVCGPITVSVVRNFATLSTQLVNKFVDEWMKHYINLVQENAEEWRAWGIACAYMRHDAGKLRPTVLYAVNLEGWFNRCNKYRRIG
jgi:lysozyme family protein